MHFEFATATEIVFGPGVARELGPRASRLGRRALVVTGRTPARVEVHVAALATAGLDVRTSIVGHEPSIDDARRATKDARVHGADVVIAIGGGSAIDLGKAVAALITNDGDPLDYVEVIGRGQPLSVRSAPFIAVPTTAGTGAEVTRNAVLTSPADGVKVSLRSALMLPTLAIVDPELTADLPPALTASTGMDALTQLVEPYVSVRANPLTDGLCLEGMPRVARSIRRATANGADRDARTDMALASLFGGLALANAGLGVVHGCAAAIGGRFDAPHGATCAALLPGAVAVNLRALRSAPGGSSALARFTTVARVLTGDPAARADALAGWLRRLRDDLEIPGLTRYGITADAVAPLAEAAARASSTRGNPVALGDAELREIIASGL